MSLRHRLFAPTHWELWAVIVLGTIGFLLNMLELQLGWGLHFIFGNALIFAFVRVLRPQWLVVAASISSLRSVFLWNHPWAWLIWTLEAGFVARAAWKSASPVRASVVYWVLVGTPLLIVTYGVLMEMDRLSLLLVIAKQATNGVLNVVIGELIYLALLSLKAPGKWTDWPKMPIGSFLKSLLLAIILIPMTVYLAIDAPAREQSARESVDGTLQKQLQITCTTISVWADARATILRMFADKQLGLGRASSSGVPTNVSREFSEVSILTRDGTLLWSSTPSGVPQGTLRQLASDHVGSADSVRLSAIGSRENGNPQQLVLIVPYGTADRPAVIIAPVRAGILQQLLTRPDRDAIDGTFLTNSVAGTIALGVANPVVIRNVQNIPENLRTSAHRAAVLVSNVAYGNALMSDLRDAQMIRVSPISGLPDWQVLAVASLAPEVLKAREGQLKLFSALCAFVLLVTLIAVLLNNRTRFAFRQLAQSAADLAILGTRREKIDSLVIAELNEISGSIASASSTVSRQRGALASYQRRLDSIAQHAPIVVYALDVQNYRKGELVYVSEAVETILGYKRDEVADLGWWSHTVHPEDYDRCIAVFGNLQPGKVVKAEYRLRHKLGHYVWVYDTRNCSRGWQ